MDATTGDTMTPPRDPDAPTQDFAPVIPLRRRQPDGETTTPAVDGEGGRGGIWDPDAPPTNLTERRQPHDPPTSALTTASAANLDSSASQHTDMAPAARPAGTAHRSRRRHRRIAAACGALATAPALALTFALAGSGHPHPHQLAKVPLRVATEHTATNAATATRPKRRPHRVESRNDLRSRAHPKRERKTPAGKATLAASTHTSLPEAPAVQSPTLAAPPTQTAQASTQTAQTPHLADGTAKSRAAAAACVPGELGC